MARINALGIHNGKQSLWAGVIHKDFFWEEFELELKDAQGLTNKEEEGQRDQTAWHV